MAYHSRYHIRAVAIVIDDNQTGATQIVGSNRVMSTTIEINTDFSDGYNNYGISEPIRGATTARLEAICADLQWHTAQPMATQPHLSQRGIYLPDMSFRALPSPEEM